MGVVVQSVQGQRLAVAPPKVRPLPVRQRSEGVEFRVELFAGILGEQLTALRAAASTESDTVSVRGPVRVGKSLQNHRVVSSAG